jgi:hypothetical protein
MGNLCVAPLAQPDVAPTTATSGARDQQGVSRRWKN